MGAWVVVGSRLAGVHAVPKTNHMRAIDAAARRGVERADDTRTVSGSAWHGRKRRRLATANAAEPRP
jgi:hypothetical protein